MQTSANTQGYNNSPNILITTDRIFIKKSFRDRSRAKKFLIIFWKSSVECMPPPNTRNGAPDETKTADYIFMNILPEMYIGIRKSSLQFGSHPLSADPNLWSMLPGGDTCAPLSAPPVITAWKGIFPKVLFSVVSVIFFFFFFFVWLHDNSWKAQAIRTKFSHKTFNWNSSAMCKNGHHKSHVTLIIGGFCANPEILHTSDFNQSKPNFHTWLLTEISHPSSKMGIKCLMQPP